MELSKELLGRVLAEFFMTMMDTEWESVAVQIAQSLCCQTLQNIKAVMDDDSLDDPTCFQKIEAIVDEFEALGSSGGSRHDFG